MADDNSVDLTDGQIDFLDRFIMDAPAGSGTGPAGPDYSAFVKAWPGARKTWLDANDEVNSQVSALQARLKSTDDAELNMIGDMGINAFTGGTRVSLMAAVLDLDKASGQPSPAQVSKARGAIDALRGHLSSDPRIRACDSNPFGVSMSIAATLGGALSALGAALDAAPQG